jgi:hypothetical protein
LGATRWFNPRALLLVLFVALLVRGRRVECALVVVESIEELTIRGGGERIVDERGRDCGTRALDARLSRDDGRIRCRKTIVARLVRNRVHLDVVRERTGNEDGTAWRLWRSRLGRRRRRLIRYTGGNEPLNLSLR